jgi:RNA polymerase sigma factor (TIGR02999 family)
MTSSGASRAVISGGNLLDTPFRRRRSCTRSSCDSWMWIAWADKRGGGATVISLDKVSPAAAQTSSVDVLALDEALDALSSFDERQCRVVELRFFAGLDIPETADALGISTATVEREWAMAKAWLHRRLS